MTIEEKLTRCAALIEKIKRGPVWEERVHRVDNIYDTRHYRLYRYEVRPDYLQWRVNWTNGYHRSITDREAACILKDWLEDELITVEALPWNHRPKRVKKNGACVFRQTAYPRDEWLFVLIEAAEKRLVEGKA